MSTTIGFDANRAKQSESYAYKCWYNVNYNNNTMKISSTDINEIESQWNNSLKDWKANAEGQDYTSYLIEDDDFDIAYDKGKDDAKDYAEKDGGKAKTDVGNNTATIVTGGLAAGSAAVSLIGGAAGKALSGAGNAVAKGVNNFVGGGVSKAGKLVGGKIGDKVGKVGDKISNGKVKDKSNGSWAITCPLSLATAILYTATKPNQKAVDALKNLKELESTRGQKQLREAQYKLDDITNDQMERSAAVEKDAESMEDEINAAIEEAQDPIKKEMEAKQKLHDMALNMYNEILERQESGEELSDSDKALLKQCGAQIGVLEDEIGALAEQLAEVTADATEEATEAANDNIADKMDEFANDNAKYDEQAEKMADTQAMTDLADSFDKSTKALCITESVMQGLNVATAVTGGIQAATASVGFNFYAWACVGMAAAAAGMSGKGVVDQIKMAHEVGKEMDVKNDTIKLNEQTNKVYENSLTNYSEYMDITADVGETMNETIAEAGEAANEVIANREEGPKIDRSTYQDATTQNNQNNAKAGGSDTTTVSNNADETTNKKKTT